MHVFEDIVLNYEVFGIVLVGRAKMCVIWLQNLVKGLAVRNDLIIFFLIPLSLTCFPTIRRNVHKENYRVTGRHALEVLFKPFQLRLLYVAHIVAIEIEHVVEHHIVHLAFVEGIIGRAIHFGVDAFRFLVSSYGCLIIVISHKCEEWETGRSRGLMYFLREST